MNELQTHRTLDMVAAEIRTFTASMLNNIIEIGRRMVEAKEMLPYGDFGKWIQENTGYSASTANNFMGIYTEYGAAQGSLFGGETECQTFGKLSYTKALALLALPAGEREAFVESHDVDAMSTRQLQQAIRERDEARQEAEGTALRLQELEEARDKIAEAYQAAEREKGQLRERLRELEEKGAEPAAADPAEIEAAVDAALADQAKENARQMQELQEKLRSATLQGEELQKKLGKVKADLAEAKQREKAAKAEGEAAYRSAADAAKVEAEAAKREAERLRKELAMADPVTAEFKAHFATAQAELATCRRIAGDAPPEVRKKLHAAMAALGKTLEG